MFWNGWPGMPQVIVIVRLQYLRKEEVRDKFVFLYEDKHQSFLKADTIVFDGHSQACLKYPKQQDSNFIAISQERHEI